MKYRLMAVFSCLLSLQLAYADLKVVIVTPELQDGMASLETMLAAEAGSAAFELAAMIEQLADKPLLMAGFSQAATTLGLLPGQAMPQESWLVSAGSSVALCLDDYSVDLAARLAALNPEDDLSLGLSAQPILAQLSVPLGRLWSRLAGLDAGAFLGYSDIAGSAGGVRAISGGLNLGWTLFGPAGGVAVGPADWLGLRLSAVAAFFDTTVNMVVEPGTMYQTANIDPDGPGPLNSFPATIRVEPSVRAGVNSAVLVTRLQATTGFSVLRLLTCLVGGGAVLGSGRSAVNIEADEEMFVEGYLAPLVAENGRIQISGQTGEQTALIFSIYLVLAPALQFGNFRLTIPALWQFPANLGAGVFVEMRL
ncbi:MAG: hypothetical protein A2087_06905 [Spirochaetes bacterium GWD1_61_31]|nr:MAG: hypothetical protein A2Y37_08565 [Spirochaetes bacterium GWB1_60_80]OHD31829.1 MAG: hypothetical protein A2004_09940 [Spirochaetes bacterium GWC1_61_12]OHD40078.1 MAG: hypothetical protein A2087_06905 [Spirochaetes bacterium GWD1_61_31]OHD45874.1 MAG: hypothetical protein A2Y35_04200 [Spirochaetes bacterium GWE1_60_18]OHD58417.1 MAG: hypothetical protein A2Y32_06590 [Spirochaetes bacterium GWF1_60_12]HAW85399.1 hypothetical protein [Spirochaetaceae bacterium]